MNRIVAALVVAGTLALPAGVALADPPTGPPPEFAPQSPTPAPPPELLPEQLRAELANVRSFRTTLHGLPGIATATTVVLPDRIDTQTVIGPLRSETIVIGADSYSRIGGAPWTHTTVDAAKTRANVAALLGPFETKRVTLLPDRVANGTTFGYFSTQATLADPGLASAPQASPAAGEPTTTPTSGPVAARTATTVCGFSKATYLPVGCDVTFSGTPSQLRVTYGEWNEAGNVIEAPHDVAPPTPAP